ncbi:MAG TPA: hypothetical protein VK671_16305 [Mucilaginibacter sp.]|jgi:hypothetical protein|nr:hypothetical protein [Mucilaginibacter sp.]
MKKILYLLLPLALLACKQKSNEPVKEKSPAELRTEHLQKAIKSDSYKNASKTFQLVRAILDSVKKGSMDSNAAIFVYNNSIAGPKDQVKTIAEVEKGLKQDTAYLKAVQLKVAADLAAEDSLSKIKH